MQGLSVSPISHVAAWAKMKKKEKTSIASFLKRVSEARLQLAKCLKEKIHQIIMEPSTLRNQFCFLC